MSNKGGIERSKQEKIGKVKKERPKIQIDAGNNNARLRINENPKWKSVTETELKKKRTLSQSNS